MKETLPIQLPAAQAMIDYLAQTDGVIAAILFGSAASGHLRPDSDLDIALLFAHADRPDALSLLDMRADLEQLARRDVDLVMLNGASPILAYQALKTGVLLFCRDRRAFDEYVVRVLSEYADFKHIRRPIEEAVIKRRVLR